MAKEAVTPPMVGSVKTTMYTKPASRCRAIAAETFANCIRLRMPSCIRAPPDAEKRITGKPFVVASSNRATNLAPVLAPNEPIMKPASIMASAVRWCSMTASPVKTASFRPVAA